MVNIFLHSANENFKQDIASQICRYVENVTINEHVPDIAVIDEDEDIYMQIRNEQALLPIIFLTNTDSLLSDNRLNFILKKPFKLMEMLDIVRAANNKLDNSEEGYLFFNGYELHPKNKEILDTISGSVVRLTEREVDILKYLYKTRDSYVSKNDLQIHVWQYSQDVTTHTIETHIYRVRQKVENISGRRLIVTRDGGYKLDVSE